LLVDVYGTGHRNLALELDADGEVIAHVLLSLARRDADEGDDFSEEQPLVYLDPLLRGRPARATVRVPGPAGRWRHLRDLRAHAGFGRAGGSGSRLDVDPRESEL
jgi:hypothetical protein